MGEHMMATSNEAGEIAERWHDAKSMLRKGEKLIGSGKEQIKEGKNDR
jgi:hypothetical protein